MSVLIQEYEKTQKKHETPVFFCDSEEAPLERFGLFFKIPPSYFKGLLNMLLLVTTYDEWNDHPNSHPKLKLMLVTWQWFHSQYEHIIYPYYRDIPIVSTTGSGFHMGLLKVLRVTLCLRSTHVVQKNQNRKKHKVHTQLRIFLSWHLPGVMKLPILRV